MQIDSIDRRILSQLQHDASLSNQELAEKVALSPSACLRRVRALEESGIIKGYRAVLDADKLGFELEAVVHVVLHHNRPDWHEQFMAVVASHEEIVQASTVTGASNYILVVRTRDLKAFSRFIEDKLIQLPNVRDVCSHIVMRKVKDHHGVLPLGSG